MCWRKGEGARKCMFVCAHECECVCVCVCVREREGEEREREHARARVEERARDTERGWGKVGGAGGGERSSVCSSVCEKKPVCVYVYE